MKKHSDDAAIYGAGGRSSVCSLDGVWIKATKAVIRVASGDGIAMDCLVSATVTPMAEWFCQGMPLPVFRRQDRGFSVFSTTQP